jgi:hypothetical protein
MPAARTDGVEKFFAVAYITNRDNVNITEYFGVTVKVWTYSCLAWLTGEFCHVFP